MGKRVLTILCVCFAAQTLLWGQNYYMEGGLAGGVSRYYGDMSAGKSMETGVSPQVSALLRYNINFNSALKLTLGSDNMTIRQLKTGLMDATVQYELNFFQYSNDYGYRGAQRFTPYIGAGLGGAVLTHGSQTMYGLVVPITIGCKYKVLSRLNVGFELSAKWISDDGFDGVKQDQYQWYKHKDWLFGASLYVTFDFWQRHPDGMNISTWNRLRKQKNPFYQE